MNKSVTFTLDADVYEKFSIALNLTNETQDTAVESCLRWYIAKTFEKASHAYNPNTVIRQNENINKDFYGKANQRIPVWAVKPNQYNHKIIRAYFTAVATTGRATIDMMERLCSDENNQVLYVPTFKNNYSQMKLDGPKSHGKVFEDDGKTVTVWREVEDTLMKYKLSFCD
ncbi:hypothetical protein [Paenibacillus sp. KR2-11]|uniref:hypothetical protein n=1 Tax=Paenibacillus sp. KR2-11 TaxID=3385500 RepID=UPI0038FBE579